MDTLELAALNPHDSLPLLATLYAIGLVAALLSCLALLCVSKRHARTAFLALLVQITHLAASFLPAFIFPYNNFQDLIYELHAYLGLFIESCIVLATLFRLAAYPLFLCLKTFSISRKNTKP